MFETEIEIELNTIKPKKFEFDLYDKNDRTKILELLNGEVKIENETVPHVYNEDKCVYLAEKLADYLKHKGGRKSIANFKKTVNKSKNTNLKSKAVDLNKVTDFVDSNYPNYTRYNQETNTIKNKGKITKYNSSNNFLNNINMVEYNSILYTNDEQKIIEEKAQMIEKEKIVSLMIDYDAITEYVLLNSKIPVSDLTDNLYTSATDICCITQELLLCLNEIIEKGEGKLISDELIRLSGELSNAIEENNFTEKELKITEELKFRAGDYLDMYLSERIKIYMEYFNYLTIDEKINIFETLLLIRRREIKDLDNKINSGVTDIEIGLAKNPIEKENLIKTRDESKKFKFTPSFKAMADCVISIVEYMGLMKRKGIVNECVNYIIEKIEKNFNDLSAKNPKYNIIEDLLYMDYINDSKNFKEKLMRLAPLSNWHFLIDSNYFESSKQPFILDTLGSYVLLKIAKRFKEISEMEEMGHNNAKNKLAVAENFTIHKNVNKEISGLVVFEKVLDLATKDMVDIGKIDLKRSKSLDSF